VVWVYVCAFPILVGELPYDESNPNHISRVSFQINRGRLVTREEVLQCTNKMRSTPPNRTSNWPRP